MILIILVVLGAFDFMTMTFQIENITKVSYWSHILARTICLMCALNVGINLFMPQAEERNILLQRDAIRYDGLVGRKEQRSFDEFITLDFNIDEKKKAWVAHINKRINRLGKWHSANERMLWSMPQERIDNSERLSKAKAKSRYCKKRNLLEEMKTEDWLNKNIEMLTVRNFHAIDPSIFDLSINGKEKYSGYRLSSQTPKARSRKTATSILMMITASMLITIWGFDLDQALFINGVVGWISAVVNALLDISFVLWQFVRGILYAPKLIEDEVHRPYIDRIRVLIKYFLSKYSPFENFKTIDDEITAAANKTINEIQEEEKKAKEEKNFAKLLKIQEDNQNRVHDSFNGKIGSDKHDQNN